MRRGALLAFWTIVMIVVFGASSDSGLGFGAGQCGWNWVGPCCQEPLVRRLIVDKLECYVKIGFWKPPKNIVLGGNLPAYVKPAEVVPLWIKAMYKDRLDKPVPGRQIELSVVDTFGRDVSLPKVEPALVITSTDGFVKDQVNFSPGGEIGVFRIRSTYSDYQTTSVGYSPAIHVLRH